MSARVAARVHGSLTGEATASGSASDYRFELGDAAGFGMVAHSGDEPICTVTVPVKTVSELNRHEHWRIRAKRAKLQHAAVGIALIAEGFVRNIVDSPTNGAAAMLRSLRVKRYLPLHVHLIRLSARKLDTDNLAGALKHCRDAVAKFLGVDDGNEAAVSWSVGQERQKGFGVRVEFYRRQS